MASILAFSLCLPVGAGICHLIEERQCFRTFSDDSIAQFLWRRIHGYTLLTWLGFGFFLYVIYTGSAGMAMVDPTKTAGHSAGVGAVLGGLAGIMLGCGLYGLVVNHNQIRAGDFENTNESLAVQLMIPESQDEAVV